MVMDEREHATAMSLCVMLGLLDSAEARVLTLQSAWHSYRVTTARPFSVGMECPAGIGDSAGVGLGGTGRRCTYRRVQLRRYRHGPLDPFSHAADRATAVPPFGSAGIAA